MICRWQILHGKSSLVVDTSCSDEVDKLSGKNVHTPDTLGESNHINIFNNLSLALLIPPRLFLLTSLTPPASCFHGTMSEIEVEKRHKQLQASISRAPLGMDTHWTKARPTARLTEKDGQALDLQPPAAIS